MDSLKEKLSSVNNPIVLISLGILISSIFYFKEINIIYLFIFTSFLFLYFIWKKSKAILLIILSIITGYFYTVFMMKIFIPDVNHLIGIKNIYIGEVLSEINNADFFYKKYYFQVNENKSTKEKLKFKVLVYGSHFDEVEKGDIIQVKGKLEKPKSAFLPGLFDERKFLLSKKTGYILKSEDGSLVYLGNSKFGIIKKKLDSLREKILNINRKYLSDESFTLTNSIIFGGKVSHSSDELKEKIRNLGLSHITSASGFNVGILTFTLFYLFNFLKMKSYVSSLICILVVIFYSLLADLSPSIVRASGFAILILIGNLLNRNIKILPGISLIFIIFFLLSPTNILDIGFQLSLLAFSGLILFYKEFEEKTPIFLKNFISSVFIQTFIAQIMVVPLIVFYFHNIQILGLISNIIAVPIASLILIIGMTNAFLALIPGFFIFQKFFCFLLNIFSYVFILWVNFLDKFPYKLLYLPNLDFYFLLFIYISIFSLIILFLLQEFRNKISYLIPVFLIIGFFLFNLTNTSKYLKIFFIPKYNGEITLIIPPKEKPVFIGNTFSESDEWKLKHFLRLNNVKNDFVFYNLKNPDSTQIKSRFLSGDENTIKIKKDDFTFILMKNFKAKINENIFCLRLPSLKREMPNLNTVFDLFPKHIIVNDYRKLSKNAIKNIDWLKKTASEKDNVNVHYLSGMATVVIITDGKHHNISEL